MCVRLHNMCVIPYTMCMRPRSIFFASSVFLSIFVKYFFCYYVDFSGASVLFDFFLWEYDSFF